MEVDGVNGCLGSFMVLKDKFPHLKVLLSIGGVDSSQSFRILSETAARRDNFAKSANLLVREARLDGIDSKFSISYYELRTNVDFSRLAASR